MKRILETIRAYLANEKPRTAEDRRSECSDLLNRKTFVKVKTHSHQFYSEVQGELLLATSGVERYGDKHMQVPALLIKTDKGISFVKLEKDCYWTEVEILEAV